MKIRLSKSPKIFLSIILLLSKQLAFADFEQEPNNTSASATAISINTTEISGNLYSADDLDYFKITSDSAGVLEISIRPENNSYDGGSIKVSILDANLNAMSARLLKSDSTGVSVRANVSIDDYFVLISKYDNYRIFDKDYILSASIDQQLQYEVEPNDTSASATAISINTTEISGNLYSAGDLDYFKITSNSAGVLEISIRPENNLYDGGSLKVSILDTSLNALSARKLTSDSTGVIVRANVSIDDYFVLISQYDNYQIFDKDYALSASINQQLQYEDELNDTQQNATPLPAVNTPTTISGNVSSVDDIDWYETVVAEKTILIISVAPENDTYDGGAVAAEIVDEQGVIHAARKISSDRGLKELKATLLPGKHYLKLSQFDNTQIMNKDYVISLSTNNDDQAMMMREQEKNDVTGSENIKQFSQTIIGQLSSNDDIDIYRVISDYTGVVEYSFGPVVSKYDGGAVGLSVANENGEILVTRPAGSDYANTISFFAYEDHTYYLIVKEFYDLFTIIGPAYLRIFDKDYYINVSYPVPYNYESEFNDDCNAARDISDYDDLYAIINEYEDIDCYPLTMLAGGFAEFQVSPIFSAYDGGTLKATVVNQNGDIITAKDVKSDAPSPVSLVLASPTNQKYFLIMTRKEGYKIYEDREYYINFEIDSDGDAINNSIDSDDDNDGVADISDTFPLDPMETIDTDGDGIGNNADLDDDNDGIADVDDLYPLGFADVPAGAFAFSFIEKLALSGITAGCGNADYCPDEPVTRAQMAVFLERGMNGSSFSPPAATGNVFLDVGASDFAASYIEQLAADGISAGCGNSNYCPDATVTRAQMAVFLLRAKHSANYSPPPATGVFNDVDLSYWAVSWIEQLAAEGITGGCGNNNYCPDTPVTRAQMAVFLVRTFGL